MDEKAKDGPALTVSQDPYSYNKKWSCRWSSNRIRHGGLPKSHMKYLLKQKIIKRWQKNWDDPKTTERCEHNPVLRISRKRLWSNHVLTAYLANHEAFPEYSRKCKVQDVDKSHPLCGAHKSRRQGEPSAARPNLIEKTERKVPRIMDDVKEYLKHPKGKKRIKELG